MGGQKNNYLTKFIANVFIANNTDAKIVTFISLASLVLPLFLEKKLS